MKQFITNAISICCQSSVYGGFMHHKHGECKRCNKLNGYHIAYPEPSMNGQGLPVRESRNL